MNISKELSNDDSVHDKILVRGRIMASKNNVTFSKFKQCIPDRLKAGYDEDMYVFDYESYLFSISEKFQSIADFVSEYYQDM